MGKARLIGITGGIGAGKSVVSRILRLKGFPVYDCDSEAKRIMAESEEIRSNLIKRFGQECLRNGKELNRELIASRIFNDSDSREWLNHMVHSAVSRDLKEWHKGNTSIGFVESAIMHTSGLDMLCDKIWLVDAPENLRMDRAMNRGGITESDLISRMESQKNEFESLPFEKTIIIYNDGRSLLFQIDKALD